MVAAFVADGWTTGMESRSDRGRRVYLSRDGFTVSVGGNVQAEEGMVASVGVSVSSPCVDSPADIRRWTPSTVPEAP